MENIHNILKKKEKNSIDISELLMKHPELFQPIGRAVSISEHNTTYENENLKVSFNYEPITVEDFYESGTPEQRIFFGAETPRIDLKEYWKLTKFTLASDSVTYNLPNDLIVLVRKEHNIDTVEGFAYQDLDLVVLNSMPSSPEGILVLMHELGHMSDEQISEDDQRELEMNFKAIIAGDYSEEMQQEKNAITLRQERFAWAQALKNLRPFLNSFGVSKESIDTFIHDFNLGAHCEAMPETEHEKLAA